jgi:predicted Rossmann fold nucleotide-binding protein DprA/Smf involved in DNA uptake
MLDRNHRLVDAASLLLAVYNGERRGGTAATIRYAQKLGREIYVVDPVSLDISHSCGGQA